MKWLYFVLIILVVLEVEARAQQCELDKILVDLKDTELSRAFIEKPELVDSWKVFKDKGLDVLSRNPDALKYLDDLKGTAKFGNDGITDFTQLKNKWDQMFPSTVNPDGTSKLVRHHAVEQQVLTKYPGVVSDVEMQSINNLRGIPKDINSEVHLSAIRKEWNDFYKTFDQSGTVPTKQQLLDKATEIDNKFGNLFDPPLR